MQPDTEEVAGSSPVAPTINQIELNVCRSNLLIFTTIRGLEGAEFLLSHKALEGQCLRFPPFLGQSLLVNIHCDPAISMPEESLNRLDFDRIMT